MSSLCCTSVEQSVRKDCFTCFCVYTENVDEYIFEKDNSNNNLLHIASINGSTKCLKSMLSHIILKGEIEKVNNTNKYNKSPLLLSIDGNHVECSKLLCKYTNYNEDILLASVKKNNIYVFSKIIKNLPEGIDLKVKDNDKKTILHYATSHDDCKCLKLILENGVCTSLIKKRDKEGYTPLHNAVECYNMTAVKLLLDYCESIYSDYSFLDNLTKDKGTIVHSCCANYDNAELLELFLSKYPQCRPQLLLKTKYGSTPLVYAFCRNISILKEILKYEEGRESILVILGEKKEKYTILHNNSSLARVRKLSKCEQFYKILNNKNHEGNTPLHIAVSFNNDEVLQFLLECGANYKIKNDSGETPLNLAREEGCKSAIKIIRKFIKDQKELDVKQPE